MKKNQDTLFSFSYSKIFDPGWRGKIEWFQADAGIPIFQGLLSYLSTSTNIGCFLPCFGEAEK
jgi:hypothetical protein